jgi:hypothetical protein
MINSLRGNIVDHFSIEVDLVQPARIDLEAYQLAGGILVDLAHFPYRQGKRAGTEVPTLDQSYFFTATMDKPS